MYEEKIVLCGANSYEEKYYLNPDFSGLPDHIKDELKIMCVLYVNDVGGVLTLVYEENGELCFEVTSEEFDPMFDEIGSQFLHLLCISVNSTHRHFPRENILHASVFLLHDQLARIIDSQCIRFIMIAGFQNLHLSVLVD